MQKQLHLQQQLAAATSAGHRYWATLKKVKPSAPLAVAVMMPVFPSDNRHHGYMGMVSCRQNFMTLNLKALKGYLAMMVLHG